MSHSDLITTEFGRLHRASLLREAEDDRLARGARTRHATLRLLPCPLPAAGRRDTTPCLPLAG